MEETSNGAKSAKGLLYAVTRIIILLLIIVLIWAGFQTGSNSMNVNVIVKDAFTKRAESVLSPKDDDDMMLQKLFTQNFIATDIPLNSTAYEDYSVTNFYQRNDAKFKFVWPWQTKATVSASEQITDITGVYNVSEEDVQASMNGEDTLVDTSKKTPPEWTNGVYEVTLIKSGGSWKIDQMKMVEIIEPEPTQAPEETPAESAGAEQSAEPSATESAAEATPQVIEE